MPFTDTRRLGQIDDVTEGIRRTTEASMISAINPGRMFPTKVRTPGTKRGLWECTYLTFAPHIAARKYICALLHPDPARRLTAEQRCHTQTRLTSFVAPMELDLCGLCANFDPRAHADTGPIARCEK